jgi:hypothetical protein
MRFYTTPPQCSCGIALPARTMDGCLRHQAGALLVHRARPASPETLRKASAPSREESVGAVACLLTWDGLADLWAHAGRPWVRGPARSRQALPGGTATNRPDGRPEQRRPAPRRPAPAGVWLPGSAAGAPGGAPAPLPAAAHTRGTPAPSPADPPAGPPARDGPEERLQSDPRRGRRALACSRRAPPRGRRSGPACRRCPLPPRCRLAARADGPAARRTPRVLTPSWPRHGPAGAGGPARRAPGSHPLPAGPGGGVLWALGPRRPGSARAALGHRQPAARPGVSPRGLRGSGRPLPPHPSGGSHGSGPLSANTRPGSSGDGLGSSASPGGLLSGATGGGGGSCPLSPA